MADIDFDDSFVTVVNTNDEKQRVPRHFLEDPTLSAGFRLAPSQAAADEIAAAAARSEGPSDDWTVNALRSYAVKHGIDLGGATTKADILTALNQTPDATEASDETPAAGDDKEN